MCSVANAGLVLGITSVLFNLGGGVMEEEAPYIPWYPEDEGGNLGPLPIPGGNPPIIGIPPFNNTPLFPDYATPDSHPGAYLDPPVQWRPRG